MCGIAGWVSWNRDLRAEKGTIDEMTATMSCRGPDAEGIWSSASAALGHRRLAVIDIEGGTQPMVGGTDSKIVLTYSGEVYNFQEIRAELMRRGHHFRTRSDTEVVVHAYLEWDTQLVEHLNGMYAFAIWDQARERLLLVRDRLGIKPLYYFRADGNLVFGSEPKALLANSLVRPEVDDTGLAELVVFPGPRTPGEGIYKGVRELRPGHVYEFTRDKAAETRYWQLVSAPHHDDQDATVRTVRDLLEDIVRRQLVSDVPLCSLLSGGVDSSALAALGASSLQETTGTTLNTFSVDFVDSQKHFDEQGSVWWGSLDAPYVRQVADHIKSDHTSIVVDNDTLIQYEDIGLTSRDLPSWGDFDVSLYRLFQGVRERSTVALSGESADEVFGGYYYFHDPDSLQFDGFPWLKDGLALAELLQPRVRARLAPADYARQRYTEAMAEVPRLDGEPAADARIREVFYLALTRWLTALLDRKDRISMALGLEVRVPFCDHRLVEYVWNVPWAVKEIDGIEKSLLRRAVHDVLPPSVAWRKKSGYPPARDDSYAAYVRRQLVSLLEDTSAPVFEIFDPDRIRDVLEGRSPFPHIPTAPSRSHTMSYLVSFNKWIKNYDINMV